MALRQSTPRLKLNKDIDKTQAIIELKEQIETGRHIKEKNFDLEIFSDKLNCEMRVTYWVSKTSIIIKKYFDNSQNIEKYIYFGYYASTSQQQIDNETLVRLYGNFDYLIKKLKMLTLRLEGKSGEIGILKEELNGSDLKRFRTLVCIYNLVHHNRGEWVDFETLEDELEYPSEELSGILLYLHDSNLIKADSPHRISITHTGIKDVENSLLEVPEEETSKQMRNDIFIVLGHDEAAKAIIARFIDQLGLNAIILQEQPDAGRTIIEKFEHCSNVGFAIVLFTPDDIGSIKDEQNNSMPRARQNVVFELGYFIGKLGRSKVCLLRKEGTEIPSDYHGVIYETLDSHGAWKTKLAREIENSGIEIDSDKFKKAVYK